MVEELRKEREASSLDVEEITNFISGNEALTARRREICKPRPSIQPSSGDFADFVDFPRSLRVTSYL